MKLEVENLLNCEISSLSNCRRCHPADQQLDENGKCEGKSNRKSEGIEMEDDFQFIILDQFKICNKSFAASTNLIFFSLPSYEVISATFILIFKTQWEQRLQLSCPLKVFHVPNFAQTYISHMKKSKTSSMSYDLEISMVNVDAK